MPYNKVVYCIHDTQLGGRYGNQGVAILKNLKSYYLNTDEFYSLLNSNLRYIKGILGNNNQLNNQLKLEVKVYITSKQKHSVGQMVWGHQHRRPNSIKIEAKIATHNLIF